MQVSRRPKTLSTYLLILGFLPGRIGAWIWTFWGIGSCGVFWERTSGCVIPNFVLSPGDRHFVATHAPFGIAGAIRLWHSAR